MRNRRLAVLSLFAVGTVAILATPVAAADSTTDALISGLNEQLLAVAIPITLLVEGILLYTVLRFRNADEAKPTQENRRLEIIWTVATALILLWVGVSTFTVLADEDVTKPEGDVPTGDDVEVHVEAYQWAWEFGYAGTDVSTAKEIVIPADREVYFNITSRDVIHAFHVPALGLKQDAMPGQYNTIKTTPTNPGNTYQGYCAEYCGVSHSNMLFTVEVVSSEEYDQWLDEQSEDGNASSVTAPPAGV
jgi:cytochrome c oxidase subunit 2